MYLHLGMTGAVLDCAAVMPGANAKAPMVTSAKRLLTSGEMQELFHRYNEVLNDGQIHWKHPYQEGDLVMIDNLAVAHKVGYCSDPEGGSVPIGSSDPKGG